MSEALARLPALAGSEARPSNAIRLLFAVVLLLLGSQACASLSIDDGALLVSAASSVAPAIGELAAIYEIDHPDLKIRLNSGASGVLLQQIRRGAPVDLFISASAAEMDLLQEGGWIDRRKVAGFASNRLVWVTPSGTASDDDGRPRIDRYASIAVANPRTAPLGRYTRQAVTALDAWETLGPKAVTAENARQVVEYVARGEVEAGIVYLSDALRLERRVERGPLLDPATHQPIVYYAGVPRDAPHPEPAAGFLRYLRSEAASAVLVRHGFPKAEE